MSKFTWNDENTAQLEAAVDKATEVSQEQLVVLAEELETTPRSIGSKLRKLGYEVQKATAARASAWSEAQEAALVEFLNANEGDFTYGEIAAAFEGGAFNAKQVQGKILSLEMTSFVKPTERVAPARKYSAEQEAQFIEMANNGSFLEDIAAALNVSVQSARGKALSLSRSHNIEIPKCKESTATSRKDVLDGLEVEGMTVAQIAEATGKTERGIKSMLSRRGISCEDYKGAEKRAKLDAKDAE